MSERIAIPLFGDQVAPRFRYADQLLLVELGHGEEPLAVDVLTLERLSWNERLSRLAEERVSVLLCGGFERCYLPLAESHGITVEWGLAGDARALAEAYRGDGIEGYRVGASRPLEGRPARRANR